MQTKATLEREIQRLRRDRSRITMDLAARGIDYRDSPEIREIDSAIKGTQHQIAVILDSETREKRAEIQDASRAQKEGAEFWFRRFFIALGIANAAAFAALASGLVQADKPSDIAPLVANSMTHFTWGMLAAGVIPLWLWIRFMTAAWIIEHTDAPSYQRTIWHIVNNSMQPLIVLATVSSVWKLAEGLFTALGTVRGLIPR